MKPLLVLLLVLWIAVSTALVVFILQNERPVLDELEQRVVDHRRRTGRFPAGTEAQPPGIECQEGESLASWEGNGWRQIGFAPTALLRQQVQLIQTGPDEMTIRWVGSEACGGMRAMFLDAILPNRAGQVTPLVVESRIIGQGNEAFVVRNASVK